MEIISLPQASKLTSPNPLALVCTLKPDKSTNLATVSWWTYVSFKPGMIAFAMSQKSYSGEMIRAGKKVILAIPGAEIAAQVMGCGSSTGRDTDKAAELGIEMQELEESKIRIPLHSRAAILCSLKEYHEVGDHYLYICDVDKVFGNEQEEAVFAWNGYAEIRPAR